MQTPPCPVCGTPLRPFPEMNAWGCDRCQQMMPAAPQPTAGRKPGGWSHAPQTQGEKLRTLILLGILIVAVIGVVVMLASDDKGSEEDEEGAPAVEATGDAPETAPPPANTTPAPPAPAPAPAPAPVPAPATGAATTPKGAAINIAECAELVELRKKVEGCAAIADASKTTLYGMVDNKMSVFDTAPPTGDYAETVKTKCAGTGEALRESLAQASCQ